MSTKAAFSLIAVLAIVAPVLAQPPGPPAPGGSSGAIAFVSDRDGDDYEVYTMNPDGSRVQQITDNDTADWYPAWSPDAAYLALGASMDGEDYEIVIMEADGANPSQITDNTFSDLDPAWASAETASESGGPPAPPGAGGMADARLVFVSERDGDQDIYLMESPDDEARALTDNATPDKDPVWAPDGMSVFYAGEDADGDFEIYVLALDDPGAAPRALTDNDAEDEEPAVSPTGRYVAFSSDREGSYDIYVLDIYTQSVRRLTEDPGYDISPAWSPKGEQIVFSSDRDGDYEIYVMDADGENLRQLTDNDASDLGPDWAPEGEEAEPEEEEPTEAPPLIVTATPVTGGSSAEEDDGACRVVNDDPGNVNVRSGPGTHYHIRGQLSPGEESPVTGYNGSWFRINYRGSEAWVANWVIASLGDCLGLVRVEAPPTPIPPTDEPTAVPPPPGDDGVRIDFWADSTSISPGDCTMLHWRTENIQAVFFEGTGVVGNGDEEVCPGSTTTYTLEVELRDGTTETRTVTVSVGAGAQPDLYIAGITLNPATPVEGEPVDVLVTVTNGGSAPVPATSYRVEWWASASAAGPECTWDVGSLGVGASHNLSCIYGGYPSWYASLTVQAVVDVNDTITEANEANNTYTNTISVSEAGLTAPVLVAPTNGTVLDHYPRTTTLQWQAVSGAASYMVEVQYDGGGWAPWKMENVTDTDYTFEFVGAQPGRWRVWAVAPDATEGPKSPWWTFEYTH